jgi:hypothetical protein
VDNTDLGDVDVLAVCKTSRRIWAFETKDFGAATLPYQINNDLDRMFVSRPKRKSVIAHVQERMEWLTENQDALSLHLEIDASDFSICGAIVTSEKSFAPHIKASPFPIVTPQELPMLLLPD